MGWTSITLFSPISTIPFRSLPPILSCGASTGRSCAQYAKSLLQALLALPVDIPSAHRLVSITYWTLVTPHNLTDNQCIRSWLDSSKICPSCNEPASEGMLRRNRTLEEITEAWDETRWALLAIKHSHRGKERKADRTIDPSL